MIPFLSSKGGREVGQADILFFLLGELPPLISCKSQKLYNIDCGRRMTGDDPDKAADVHYFKVVTILRLYS